MAAQFAREGWGDAIETLSSAPPEPEAPMETCSLGQGYFPKAWASNDTRMAAGAIGENLTSCGGQLPNPCFGQHGVWNWIGMGASAAYGTVSEPCNFTQKFPNPLWAYYYARGWSAAEALWMSVENPYQGLFAGDPLAAPHAAKPRVSIERPVAGETVGADTVLEVRVGAAEVGGAPPVYLDLYIDGRHYTPMARPIGAGGNEVSVEVGGREYRYTVQRDDDLYGVAEGVAWSVRTGSGGAVRARAHGDSVTLEWTGGDEEEVSARVKAGLAHGVRMGARTCTPRSVPEGDGRQGAEVRLWMGTAREYPLEYPIDLSFLEPGRHTLSIVARDGTAVQAQGRADVEVRVERGK